MRTLCVLLTNNALANRAGSETYLRDVALSLLRRGHRPVAFSVVHGAVAEDGRERIEGGPPALGAGQGVLDDGARAVGLQLGPKVFDEKREALGLLDIDVLVDVSTELGECDAYAHRVGPPLG